jgi:hypothetical protein
MAHEHSVNLTADQHGTNEIMRRRGLSKPLVWRWQELANRIRHQLWRYYPQMLELTSGLWAEWCLELWYRMPVPSHLDSDFRNRC